MSHLRLDIADGEASPEGYAELNGIRPGTPY
jgi:hypothetical protein